MRTGQVGSLATVALLALPLALLLGAIVPRNPGWQEPAEGIEIAVHSSPAHTELVLPVAVAGHDWRDVLPAGTVPPGTTHLSFSWGDAEFFLATPTWADLRLHTAAQALFASRGSFVHLHRLAGSRGRPIRLSPDAYGRLVEAIGAEIGPGGPTPGYGADDLFLPSPSHYSGLRTCNNWAADMLADAGVRVGVWTPLPQTLIWRFEERLHEGG